MSAEYCIPVAVFHFWPKLTHPAARSLCDIWATCSDTHRHIDTQTLQNTIPTSSAVWLQPRSLL